MTVKISNETRRDESRVMAKILIVDDSVMQAKSMARLVEKLGYETIVMNDGKDIVNIVNREKPDLILMDVVMPEVNGFQATRHLHKNKTTEHIPVILVSGKSQETDKKWGFRQGAKGYIVKPVSPDLLSETIHPFLVTA